MADQHTLIRDNTIIARTPLVPEIALHLITEACPLWRASEKEAAAKGLIEPYWAFAWPGGQALARHILDNPQLVKHRRVLDFGSGCAIEGIAAALAGASDVLCADIDPLAGIAARLNAELNGVTLRTTERNLIGRRVECDLVLAGDIFYDKELAAQALQWLRDLDVPVLIGDPSRGFLDTSTLRNVASYRAGADGSFDLLRDTAVYAIR